METMVKMQIPGITIAVPEKEVAFYKRAGYSVVIDAPEPVVEVLEVTPEPVEVKKSKK